MLHRSLQGSCTRQQLRLQAHTRRHGAQMHNLHVTSEYVACAHVFSGTSINLQSVIASSQTWLAHRCKICYLRW